MERHFWNSLNPFLIPWRSGSHTLSDICFPLPLFCINVYHHISRSRELGYQIQHPPYTGLLVFNSLHHPTSIQILNRCNREMLFISLVHGRGKGNKGRAVLYLKRSNMSACSRPALQNISSVSSTWSDWSTKVYNHYYNVQGFSCTVVTSYPPQKLASRQHSPEPIGLSLGISYFCLISIWYHPPRCSQTQYMCPWALRPMNNMKFSTMFLIFSEVSM